MSINIKFEKKKDSINSTGYEKNTVEDDFTKQLKDRNNPYVSYFIREYVQNSIDSHLEYKQNEYGDRNLSIKIDLLDEDDGINTGFFKGIYESQIKQYLEASFDTGNPFEVNNRILTYEELGTTGLTGQTTNNRDMRSHFIKFLASQGQRYKQTGNTRSLGGEGCGKVVGYMSSTQRTMFCNTSRADDNEVLHFGKVVLPRTPLIDDSFYEYNGLYLNFSPTASPIDDKKVISQFTDDAKIMSRNGSDEYGTSFVIPSPHEEFTADNIIKEILNEWLYAIIKFDISFKICGTTIDKNSLVSEVADVE